MISPIGKTYGGTYGPVDEEELACSAVDEDNVTIDDAVDEDSLLHPQPIILSSKNTLPFNEMTLPVTLDRGAKLMFSR